MTKITLRSYNREIEALSDQGEFEAAIAHCLHILKYFPKYVDTYRLLGKAYLENQQFRDAGDVFQRVLSAVPDDFVAHIGMSIIREDEGKLEAAIWHMQRAYDVQSSSITVQDELRRLYEERDGVEPDKLRLTRAALARMYARGDLISEAISELRSALKDDPNRADLLAMLARMYFLNQQRVKCIQTSSQVLNKLPYCLDSNIIISQALKMTNRGDESIPYMARAVELDPYAAFLSDSTNQIERVPDTAVMIEKLEATETGGMTEEPKPDWELLDKAAEAEDETTKAEQDTDIVESEREDLDATEIAGGLAAATVSLLEPEDLETESPDPEHGDLDAKEVTDIPDWMQEAGWEKSDEGPEESQTPTVFEQEMDQSGLYKAEIPEWMHDMAPGDAVEDSTPSQEWLESEEFLGTGENEEESEIPEWLQDLDLDEPITEEKTAPTKDALPAWLSDDDESAQEEKEDTVPEKTPESETEKLPGWLSSLKQDQPLSGAEDEDNQGTGETAEIPTWLENIDEEKVEPIVDSKDVTDTIPSVEETDFPESAEPKTRPTSALTDEVPNWLKEMADQIETDADREDDPLSSWLETADLSEVESSTSSTGEEESVEEDEEGIGDELAATAAAAAAAAPDWLQGLEDELISQDDSSEEKEESKVDVTEESTADTESAEAASDTLDWGDIEEDVAAVSEDQAEGREEGLSWIKDLSREESEQAETFIVQSEEALEDSPDWARPAKEETSRKDTDFESDVSELADDAAQMPDWLEEIEITEEEGEATVISGAESDAADDYGWQPDLEIKAASNEDENRIEVPDQVQDSTGEAEEVRAEQVAPDWQDMETGTFESPDIPSTDEATLITKPPHSDSRKMPTTPFNADSILKQAREALSKKDVDNAMQEYGKLIRRRKELGPVIDDLREALKYNHPADIDVWSTLGDAFVKNENLQDALDAYTKAEELLN